MGGGAAVEEQVDGGEVGGEGGLVVLGVGGVVEVVVDDAQAPPLKDGFVEVVAAHGPGQVDVSADGQGQVGQELAALALYAQLGGQVGWPGDAEKGGDGLDQADVEGGQAAPVAPVDGGQLCGMCFEEGGAGVLVLD